jgi:hypothetical protein
MVGTVSSPSLPGLTRQSIFVAKSFCEADGPPNSGSPEFGFLSCASRINPTCVVKPAGDAGMGERRATTNGNRFSTSSMPN